MPHYHVVAAGRPAGCNFAAGQCLRTRNQRRQSKSEHFKKVIAAALDGKPVSIFGKGDTTRDYIYIDDVIDAFAYAGAHMEKVNGQHYYLGTGTGHSVKEAFTLAVAQATAASGRKVDISHVSWPDGLSEIERRSFVADIYNLRKATGWCPEVDPAEGIKRTIATFLAGGTA